MIGQEITRRQFIAGAVALTGSTLLASCSKTRMLSAADQVTLGNTGLKMSRLGVGTGTIGGSVQRDLGSDGFNRLIRYAYDQGITYIDTAENYQTHTMVREAIKGIPRENLFIQSKMPGSAEKPLEVIDRYRTELGVDYIDSLLTHAVRNYEWDEERKRIMDAFEEAKDKKIILSHGASYHSLPALKKGAELDWTDVSLVRLNPQGENIDTDVMDWGANSNVSHVPAVVEQVNLMHEKRKGVIAMKVIGEGVFQDIEDREKAIRFDLESGLANAIVIGFRNTAEIDEAIMHISNIQVESPQLQKTEAAGMLCTV
ncbi:aldo/keto reductase [Candidatus Latescibacterota bacterium]